MQSSEANAKLRVGTTKARAGIVFFQKNTKPTECLVFLEETLRETGVCELCEQTDVGSECRRGGVAQLVRAQDS